MILWWLKYLKRALDYFKLKAYFLFLVIDPDGASSAFPNSFRAENKNEGSTYTLKQLSNLRHKVIL
jgi:hypothetical protein